MESELITVFKITKHKEVQKNAQERYSYFYESCGYYTKSWTPLNWRRKTDPVLKRYVLLCFLEYRTINRVQKPNNPTP
jgi:hypothetical protein